MWATTTATTAATTATAAAATTTTTATAAAAATLEQVHFVKHRSGLFHSNQTLVGINPTLGLFL